MQPAVAGQIQKRRRTVRPPNLRHKVTALAGLSSKGDPIDLVRLHSRAGHVHQLPLGSHSQSHRSTISGGRMLHCTLYGEVCMSHVW